MMGMMPGNMPMYSWMLFVDGENFTIRAQEVADAHGVVLTEGPYFRRNVFVWFPGFRISSEGLGGPRVPLRPHPIRSYYYTSVVGDTNLINTVRTELFNMGFHPEVFHKLKGHNRSKGVDITLAKDMLSHAYMGNYEVAILIAGDGDYVPLVNEVKRLGKMVSVLFFGSGGLSDELKLASDGFSDIEEFFVEKW
jgi:hypothetical protein